MIGSWNSTRIFPRAITNVFQNSIQVGFFPFPDFINFTQSIDFYSDYGNKKLNSWSLHQRSDDKDRERGHSSSLYPYHYVKSRNRGNCTSFKLDDLVFLKFEISLIKVRWFISQTLFIKHYFYQLKIYQTKIPNSHIQNVTFFIPRFRPNRFWNSYFRKLYWFQF